MVPGCTKQNSDILQCTQAANIRIQFTTTRGSHGCEYASERQRGRENDARKERAPNQHKPSRSKKKKARETERGVAHDFYDYFQCILFYYLFMARTIKVYELKFSSVLCSAVIVGSQRSTENKTKTTE